MESKKSEDVKKAEADASKMLKAAEHKGRQILEKAREKVDIEASKTLKEVEQKGHLIIEEAKKRAEAESSKTLKEVEQKGRLIIEEAKKKAAAEASKTLKEAEQKGRLFIEEAKKQAGYQAKAGKPVPDTDEKTRHTTEQARNKVDMEAKTYKPALDTESRASKIIAEAEQKARQIIEEAERIAAAPAAQRPQQIIKAVKEKDTLEAKGKTDQQGAAYKKRVEIVVAPPVDFAQLEKLRTSLQRLPGLRIISIGGSPGGGTQISISMDRPTAIVENLAQIDVVEEAIEEELFDSHQLSDFLKSAMPGAQAKRSRDEQRVLVVLKRAQ